MNQTYPPTVVSTLKDDDLIYISESDSGLVRVVPAEAIKPFIKDLIPDSDPVVSGEIVNSELSLSTKSGKKIEIGSVSGINLDEDYITRLYVDGGIRVLVEDSSATISQDIRKSVWPIQSITIGESPLSIDRPEQYGVDYEFSYNGSTVMSPSVLLFNAQEGAQIKISTRGMAKESKPVTVSQLTSGEHKVFWYVTTPTVFMFHEDQWRVEESSQLTHVDGSTTFDSPSTKTPVIGVASKPGSSITTEVNDGVLLIGGGVGQDVDLDEYQRRDDPAPNYKRYDIDTSGSGQPNFNASIHQDSELHTVIDATRELRVNYKDIGTGTTIAVAGIDNNQAQFLVPIYQGNEPVALAKDIPNTSNFIIKHTNAELNKLFCAYQGKFNDNRAFYPISLYQDVNGWTQFEFTANMQFKSKNKESGNVGDKVLEIKPARVVAHKDLEVLGNTIYDGDTSQPTNLINRQALDDEPQKEWFKVANGTLTTNGNRPTGDLGVEGELAVWHNVTSDSTTNPANELKIVFDGAYEKLDEFSNPLRFRLSQQGGSRNQYWTADDNGWQTEGNVWHLSASKVTGDNLVVGIETTVHASALFLADVSGEINEKIAADKAKGEWVGGVYKDTINDDGNPDDEFTCNNPKHWIEYRKTTFKGDYALIVNQGETPISSEIVIHLHPESEFSSAPFKVIANDGKEITKTIRIGEKWRFFLRKGTWPYYERIDDGTVSYVDEEQVQKIVSKSLDSLVDPGEGTYPINKHPLPNQQGYLSTYSSVMYDDKDRLVIPRNAYDRTLIELFFESGKTTAYCTIPVATVELLLGRILRAEDIELGIALDQSTSITPGFYSAETPSNVQSTWSWNGKFIPIDTENGESNDPNNPSVWLSQYGDYVYSESEAGNKPKYDQMSISDLMSKNGYTWRYALRRGYIMKDGSFVFNSESTYYVFVIKTSGYQTVNSKIHTVFFNRGGIKLYPDAISAYVDQEKIIDRIERSEYAQFELFKTAVSSQNKYGTQLSVDLTGSDSA